MWPHHFFFLVSLVATTFGILVFDNSPLTWCWHVLLVFLFFITCTTNAIIIINIFIVIISG